MNEPGGVTPAQTVWESGRLDDRGGPKSLLFGRVYEDASVELATFPPGGRLFCIASAGCTAIELARHYEVTAVDINPVQIDYVRSRLVGDAPRAGTAERVMAGFRRLGLLAGWSSAKVREFLQLEFPEHQMEYWQRELNTTRFRAALGLLFSVRLLRSFYSAPLLADLPAHLGRVMRLRMERCFARHANRKNPYARALLLGELPPRFEIPVRTNLRLECADAAGFLERQPAGSFDGFSISNILDGAAPAYAHRLFAAIQRAASPQALLIHRTFREPAKSAVRNLAAEDRSMLWGGVFLQHARGAEMV